MCQDRISMFKENLFAVHFGASSAARAFHFNFTDIDFNFTSHKSLTHLAWSMAIYGGGWGY